MIQIILFILSQIFTKPNTSSLAYVYSSQVSENYNNLKTTGNFLRIIFKILYLNELPQFWYQSKEKIIFLRNYLVAESFYKL